MVALDQGKGAARDTGTASLSACELADLLLLAVVRKRVSALVVEPAEVGHRLNVEQAGRAVASSTLDSSLADAVVARLGLLAGLDPASAADALGRLRIRAGGADTEVLVALHEDERGFGIELRRIEQGSDDATSSDSLQRMGVYRIEAELGRGGMGVVYRGLHETLDKPVAIKLINESLAQQSETAMRFLREARAASRVRHPAIVDVTDFGALADGRPFLVMELVEWPTLQDVLDNEGSLAPLRAVRIAALVADALDAVHRRGVVHRDLKPANLFLGPNDEIKVGDFGAAKLVGAAGADRGEHPSELDLLIGTPHYMSPEQARGLPIDARSDLYALGCCLFRMISGSVPFSGLSSIDTMLMHINDPVPALRSPREPVPPALAAIVERALMKDVAQRYPHAGEMLADLDGVAQTLSKGG
jgi:eukaryotic-like serine/threonine-protein kinase